MSDKIFKLIVNRKLIGTNSTKYKFLSGMKFAKDVKRQQKLKRHLPRIKLWAKSNNVSFFNDSEIQKLKRPLTRVKSWSRSNNVGFGKPVGYGFRIRIKRARVVWRFFYALGYGGRIRRFKVKVILKFLCALVYGCIRKRRQRRQEEDYVGPKLEKDVQEKAINIMSSVVDRNIARLGKNNEGEVVKNKERQEIQIKCMEY